MNAVKPSDGGVHASVIREARRMHRRRRRPVVESAGALVWRVHDGALQVQLVHRPAYQDWSWPKGKVDPGESAPAAAVREVAEETGTAVVLGIPLPTLTYRTQLGRLKRAHYWAAQQVGAADARAVIARERVHPVNIKEIDEVVWLPVAEARTTLTRESDREPLDALVRAWKRGRLTTRTLVILRHARAQKRAVWLGGEDDRALTPVGYQHAAALIPILAAYGISRIVTSPWLRCADTVGPYAGATGASLIKEEALTEAGHTTSHAAARKVTRKALSGSGAESTVLCTHRPVLASVLREVRAATKKKLRTLIPSVGPYLRPGAMLVLHIADLPKGAKVVAVETRGSYKSGYAPRPEGA